MRRPLHWTLLGPVEESPPGSPPSGSAPRERTGRSSAASSDDWNNAPHTPTVSSAIPTVASAIVAATAGVASTATAGSPSMRASGTHTPSSSRLPRERVPSRLSTRAKVTSAAGTTNRARVPDARRAATTISSTSAQHSTCRLWPLRTQPSPSRAAVAPMLKGSQRPPSYRASVPLSLPAATADRKRFTCAAEPASRTAGTNCVIVARKGPGAATRPSSSSTTANSTKLRPRPPRSTSIVSAGQPSQLSWLRKPSASAPPTATSRTSRGGHSRVRVARALSRSSSCSSVNSRCMTYLYRPDVPRTSPGGETRAPRRHDDRRDFRHAPRKAPRRVQDVSG